METLLKNIQKIWTSAETINNLRDYTSATILYFKVLFVILDFILLRSKMHSPKDHTERFRMLQRDFPDLYKILDKYFQIYRNTYSTTIDKEKCEEIRKNVIKIIEKYKIQVNYK